MLSYLFGTVPGDAFSYYYEMMALIVLLVLGSIVLKNIYKNKVRNKDFVFKKLYKKTPNRLLYFAIGFIFLLVLRYEEIPYFSMRIWMYLTSIGLLTYLGFQTYKYFKVYPKERDNYEARKTVKSEDNSKNRYLPNK
ncbi:hypothetical protein HOG17_05105 [Candidatus Peregrinibacteria bacterium]|jgi:hypothetical protein|nr:hypothetical protein [Candidatus Peregrinibacteria bacterium]MBT4148120.1 hypothetical protein [Candidatus Peregrinibacteria bacterium]MBT4366034.1 hypothetical protein [Candidatus Peregrinibacteria bacterium]MBT4455693.1 hypothetical protein [Candidatus Peregrinibacteria bacterium]